jgi:hypothetical protein
VVRARYLINLNALRLPKGSCETVKVQKWGVLIRTFGLSNFCSDYFTVSPNDFVTPYFYERY